MDTLYCFSNNINDVNDKLRIDLAQVMEWFNVNYLLLNTDNCHYMCLGKDTENPKYILMGILFLHDM